MTQDIQRVPGRRKSHFERCPSYPKFAGKGEIVRSYLVHRSVVGSEGVNSRGPGISQHGGGRPIYPDVARHREHFQIYRGYRTTFLVRDEGVTRKSGGPVVTSAT